MLKKIIEMFTPPEKWKIPILLALGVFAGFSAYTLYLSRFYSYLGEEPKTCVNCHIMGPQYASWVHSSHRSYTNCNDCHVPHNNVFNKYYFKGKDGMRHATMFTLRLEPQVIIIKEAGREVVQQNCKRCHNHTIENQHIGFVISGHGHKNSLNDRKCWDCHRETPHGSVNSISSAPFARVPVPESPVPEWLKNAMKKNKNNQ